MLQEVVNLLYEGTIAKQVEIPHGDVRGQYRLSKIGLDSIDEMKHLAADYYRHHASHTESRDVTDQEAYAASAAILEEGHGSLWKAHRNRYGAMGIVDTISDSLRGAAIVRYTSDVLKKYEKDKVQLMRECVEAQQRALPNTKLVTSEELVPYWQDALLDHVEFVNGLTRIFCR